MKSLFDLAIEYTGHDKDHLTEFQENEIDALVQFGKRVLESRPTQRAADAKLACPTCGGSGRYKPGFGVRIEQPVSRR